MLRGQLAFDGSESHRGDEMLRPKLFLGMSVQIIDKLDNANKDLKDATTADVAPHLLTMYAPVGIAEPHQYKESRKSAAQLAKL